MTIVSYSEKKKKGKRRSSRRNSLRLFSRAPPIVQRKTRSRDCSQLLKNDASFSPSSKKQWHWTKKKKQKERKRCHLRLITRRGDKTSSNQLKWQSASSNSQESPARHLIAITLRDYHHLAGYTGTLCNEASYTWA